MAEIDTSTIPKAEIGNSKFPAGPLSGILGDMNAARKSRPKPWTRLLSFLRKLDRSIPLISPFAAFPGRRAYRIFLNGNTILIERPRKRQTPRLPNESSRTR